MGIMDTLSDITARALAVNLSETQRARAAGMFVARTVKPDADASDLMILANYVITGYESIPEPKDDPYPHLSGDVVVLGPGIFSNTVMGPAENTVINWQGMNFIPQVDQVDEGWHAEVGGQRFTQAQWEAVQVYCAGSSAAAEEPDHPDDPDPQEPSGDLPDIDPMTEPAPMAGTHWQGRRGGKPG